MSILELLSAVLLHTTFLWYLAACILVLPIFAHGAYDKIILGAWSIRMLKYIRPYIFLN